MQILGGLLIQMNVTLLVHFVCDLPIVVLRGLKVHNMLIRLFLVVVVKRLDEALNILFNKVIRTVLHFVFIASFVTAVGLTVADTIVGLNRL